MKCTSEEKIMSAKNPSQIFIMNPDTLEEQRDEYLQHFKPQAYSTIRNFLIAQKITMLYKQAIVELKNKDYHEIVSSYLKIEDKNGEIYEFYYSYTSDIKLGNMYVTDDKIIYVINKKYGYYYDNYILNSSTKDVLKNKVWDKVQYMFPVISKNFINTDGDYIIIVDKPTQIYPLRQILDYFDGKIAPEYVASIMTRLYYFACYIDMRGINHNGLTVDNLFFAPGNVVEEGESFTIEDIRIVGVYGGWFYSTKTDEQKIKGVPKEVFNILPRECKQFGYSSYKVDLLSIKEIAKELLGCDNEDNIENIPKDMLLWIHCDECKENSYEEYRAWENVVIRSFGKHKFVHMDIFIN